MNDISSIPEKLAADHLPWRWRINRARGAKRRNKSISNKLHEAHRPWYKRTSARENAKSRKDNGTNIFDLE